MWLDGRNGVQNGDDCVWRATCSEHPPSLKALLQHTNAALRQGCEPWLPYTSRAMVCNLKRRTAEITNLHMGAVAPLGSRGSRTPCYPSVYRKPKLLPPDWELTL